MTNLTSTGRNVLADIAGRHHLSEQSAANMMIAVNNGGGTMDRTTERSAFSTPLIIRSGA